MVARGTGDYKMSPVSHWLPLGLWECSHSLHISEWAGFASDRGSEGLESGHTLLRGLSRIEVGSPNPRTRMGVSPSGSLGRQDCFLTAAMRGSNWIIGLLPDVQADCGL